ncbi:MAG: sodium:glutamate symporter [Synergistaceae bacterium]|jgi:ESS family glutamate:Na+ symporter|nr:sodium:glutamate symporter [Synergistaceae bacterium]
MTWDAAEGFLKLSLDPVFTAALASALFVLGLHLRKKFHFLRRFCVPAGVAGGLCMAFCAFCLYYPGIAAISFDQSLQTPLVAIFFTRIGLTASFMAIRKGGRALLFYLFFCWGLALFQNVLGVVLASLFGLHPVLGVMAGAVSLEGGHNLAVIFGPMAESMGVTGATAVAIASATYGLMAGGIMSASISEWLIARHGLELATSYDMLYKGYHESTNRSDGIEIHEFIHTLALLLALMALGSWAAGRLQDRIARIEGWEHFSLPGYLGAMFLAVIFRNLNDRLKWVQIHPRALDLISTVSVSIFLTVSMMGLRIWELYGLALPLLFILVAQTLAIIVITIFVLFPVMGKDYDAAIICSGFVGHGLGAPPSAVSMMRAACEYHNVMSYKAFLIVPLCGAVLIDLVALPSIVWFINYFSH